MLQLSYAYRRVPNQHLDLRFMECSLNKAASARSDAAWFHPSPVLNCTVWWGTDSSADISVPSPMAFTVVTEMVRQTEAGHHLNSKELCFEQYTCGKEDVPCCRCTDGSKAFKAQLRTTAPRREDKTHHSEVETRQALKNVMGGKSHHLSKLHDLGVQLPHQNLARLYYTCNRRWTGTVANQGCGFVGFFD